MTFLDKFKSIFSKDNHNDKALNECKNEGDADESESVILPELIYRPDENEIYDIDISSDKSDGKLTVITIADCHGTLMQKELITATDGIMPDMILLLRDNLYHDIETVLDFFSKGEDIPIVGISGNHDEKTLLKKEFSDKVYDIHRNKMMYDGLSFGGFNGCIKYKPESNIYALYTNEESEEILKALPACDIFLTHSNPCFEKPEQITSHSGLTGIAEYIKENEPKLVLHGHLHDRYVEKYNNTIIRCCYKVEMFNINF